jgi:hypothetical protein
MCYRRCYRARAKAMTQATKQRTTFIQQPLIPAAPRVACRDCHVVFEDVSGHQLCDGCLAEHINGAGELELDDEIDWERGKAPHAA